MNPANFTFSSKDGLSLLGRAWVSQPKNPKGMVYLIHGLGEHTGRYDHIGKVFSKKGFHMVGFDLRGHGLSEGPRGHTPGLTNLFDDISIFIEESQRYLGNSIPNFLYGHSLGGNLVINYGLHNNLELQGVIVTSPALQLSNPQPSWKITLAKLMADKLPHFKMKNGLETKALSRDAAIVAAYENDVYVHDKISARLGLVLLESGWQALEKAEHWNIPLLLMHGTADRITSHKASEAFTQKAGDCVTFISWEDYYHELHNDIGSDQVIEKMVDWALSNC